MSTVETASSPVEQALIPELDKAVLFRSAASYFPNCVPLSPDACAKRAQRFYETLDLGQRGDRWSQGDKAFLRMIVPFIGEHMPPSESAAGARRLLIVGCGNGRLAEIYLELAASYGFDHVIFNDLFAAHIAATKAKIEKLGAIGRKLRVTYSAGDFASARVAPVDLAIAMFFVSSEVCSIQSATALATVRQHFYRAVTNASSQAGFLSRTFPNATCLDSTTHLAT